MFARVNNLKNIDLYGSGFTVSFAVKTGCTFMGIYYYRRIVKPFDDAILTGLNTHLAARATIVIDLYSNMHI